MKAIRCICVAALVGAILAPAAHAQEPPKPGPEHALLAKMEGTWEASMKFGDMESKGTMVYKMDLGGLWLTSTFQGELAGAKFSGRGFDSFDAAKKKFVGVWMDSMSTSAMTLEGTFDKDTSTMTMSGEGPGMDGKPAKYKMVTVMKENTMTSSMYMGDGKDPAFVINYKRKK